MTAIWIDALSATTGGAFTVSRGLSASLSRVRPDWQFLLACSTEEAAPAAFRANLEVEVMPDARRLAWRWGWEQIVPLASRRMARFDCLLLLGGFGPMLARRPMVSVWQNANVWTAPTGEMTTALKRYIAIQRSMMRISVRMARKNVFLTQDSLSRCREVLPIPERSASVIPLGIDVPEPPDGHLPGWEDREDLVLTVGDLYVHKGHELLLRAFAIAAQTSPSLRLAVAGREIVEGRLASLRRLAYELGIATRVDFLGFVPRDEVFGLYRRARAYVNASRLESFGLTPIEAMACGTPVVSSKQSASPEVCGEAAVYYERHEPEALATRLLELLGSREEWSRRSVASVNRAADFGWDSVAERYARLVQPLLPVRPGR